MSHIVTLDDVEIHIECDGAETILMVHGWPETYRLLDVQVQAFKKNTAAFDSHCPASMPPSREKPIHSTIC